MTLQILAASWLILLAGCQTVVTEPVTTAEYYVTNNTGHNLLVQFDKANTPVLLQDSIVAPGSNMLIYKVAEMTGGHVLPSNFLTDIRVFALLASGDSLVYQGINNADWHQGGSSSSAIQLTLIIQ